MNALRLTYIAFECPYPPTHGARVDIWRRLEAFSRLGVQIQLLYWRSRGEAPIPDDTVSRVAVDWQDLRYSNGILAKLRGILRIARTPWAAAKRTPEGDEKVALLQRVREFAPTGVWIDGIWGAPLGFALSKEFDVPSFVRSHNVEHVYMVQQARLTKGWKRRLHVWFACLNLEAFEASVLRRCGLFFDISAEDLSFWESRGLKNGRWLPPLMEHRSEIDVVEESSRNSEVRRSVVFLGNLHTPNNVAGVEWLVDCVWPLVMRQDPSLRLTIAGSKPSHVVERVCREKEGVDLIPNPASASLILNSASVLVNPVPWASGVNLKAIDMLASGKPIVSTSMGVKGLPVEARQLFMVADQPEEFARYVVDAYRSTSGRASSHELVSRFFGDSAARAALEALRSFRVVC